MGCGDLFFAMHVNYSKCYESYVGIDISARALRRAKDQWKEGPLVQADAARLPFTDRFFDSITAIQTISTMGSDPYPVLKEARRVLMDEGSITFDVIHSDYLASLPQYAPELVSVDHGKLLRGDKEHHDIMSYDETGIRSLLQSIDLREDQITVFTSHEFDNLGLPLFQRQDKGPNGDVKKSMLVRAMPTQAKAEKADIFVDRVDGKAYIPAKA